MKQAIILFACLSLMSCKKSSSPMHIIDKDGETKIGSVESKNFGTANETNCIGGYIDPIYRYEAYIGAKDLEDKDAAIEKFTNVISVCYHTSNCILIRYRDIGPTNEFHAWMVPVLIIATTNKLIL